MTNSRFGLVAGLLIAGSALAGCATAGPVPGNGVTRTVTLAPSTGISPGPTAAGSTAPTPAGTMPGPVIVRAGISGMTVVDGCPVARQPPCPDKPVAARMSIMDVNQVVVATVASGADGRFSVALSPGTYLVRPTGVDGPFSVPAQDTTVSVQPDRYTTVTIRFGSGIR